MQGSVLSEEVQRLKPETVVLSAWSEGFNFGEVDIQFEITKMLEAIFGERG